MAIISAFADEIDPNLNVQMDVCQANGVRHIDIRSIDGLNVSKFSDQQVAEYRKRLEDRGFGVPCIGSPLGKVRIDSDLAEHLDLTRRVCQVARGFGSQYIRVFSFYPPQAGRLEDYRSLVMDTLSAMLDIAEEAGVTLLHENEADIYGEKTDGVKDIFATLGHDRLKGVFDPANFVYAGLDPWADCWQKGLAELTDYFHIKDKKKSELDRKACDLAGDGDGQIERILADAKARGFDGLLTLEPHLAKAERFTGYTGPDLFAQAVQALKIICDRVGLKVE